MLKLFPAQSWDLCVGGGSVGGHGDGRPMMGSVSLSEGTPEGLSRPSVFMHALRKGHVKTPGEHSDLPPGREDTARHGRHLDLGPPASRTASPAKFLLCKPPGLGVTLRQKPTWAASHRPSIASIHRPHPTWTVL